MSGLNNRIDFENMKLDVAIIDYKISNMFSVHSACYHFGLHSEITSDREKILNARAAILPGVGTFGPAMEHLQDMRLIPVIHEFIKTGKPFMGICLGMQLLLTESEEFGVHKGLNIIPGLVRKFPQGDRQEEKIRVPHIGWNKINVVNNDSGNWHSLPLCDIGNGELMYFVHSFYAVPDDDKTILTLTYYAGLNFCSSMAYKNVFACQFHPEKSGREGLKIIKNFSQSLRNEVS